MSRRRRHDDASRQAIDRAREKALRAAGFGRNRGRSGVSFAALIPFALLVVVFAALAIQAGVSHFFADQSSEEPRQAALPLIDAQLARVKAGEETKVDLTEVVADDAMIERIVSAPTVEEISIDRSTVTLAALKSLAKLPKLSVLVLGETPIDDAALAELAKCQNLVRLNISSSTVNDEAIALVAGLPKLELFRVISDKLTGAGFAALAPCQTLTYLIVGGENVDDSLLRAVEPMKNVRALYLLGTQATDEGLYKLQQARPDLHIH